VEGKERERKRERKLVGAVFVIGFMGMDPPEWIYTSHVSVKHNQGVIFVLCIVVDDISLNVEPRGQLEIGMIINISCTIRYGGPGPEELSQAQDPDIKLMLDNYELYSEQPYYTVPAIDNFQRKTRVRFSQILRLVMLP